MQILGVRVWTGDGDRVIIIIIITDLYSAFIGPKIQRRLN